MKPGAKKTPIALVLSGLWAAASFYVLWAYYLRPLPEWSSYVLTVSFAGVLAVCSAPLVAVWAHLNKKPFWFYTSLLSLCAFYLGGLGYIVAVKGGYLNPYGGAGTLRLSEGLNIALQITGLCVPFIALGAWFFTRVSAKRGT